MLKPYHIHNENFEITHAQVFEEGTQPENAVYIEYCDFIKPMFNPETKAVYEGASQEEINEKKQQEIEVIREQTSLAISEYMREHKERFIFRQIEIPQYAWGKYDEMRAEYQIKKQAILNR